MSTRRQLVKLKTLCQQIRGVSYTPEDAVDTPKEGYLPLLRANNIQDKIIIDDLVYVNHKRISTEQKLKEGDILVCTSSGSRRLVGKAAMIHDLILPEASFGAFCKVIRPMDVFTSYLAHFFNSSYYRNTISKIAQGANINNIRNEHLNDLDVPLPKKSKQKQIANRLDKVQELISKHKEQIAKLDTLIKSRFLDMFGDPMRNPKNFAKQSISCLIEKEVQPAKKIFLPGDIIKYVDISSINNKTNEIEKTSNFRFIDAPSRAQQYILEKDILISTVRPNLKNIAQNKMKDKNLVASSGFCILRAIKCEPLYLLSVVKLENFTHYLTRLTKGANYPAVKDKDVYDYKVPMPPLTLQTQFADFVMKVETQKGLLSTRLSQLETLYKSLMQEYFG